MNCWKCGKEIDRSGASRILVRDCCPQCDSDLHACMNCRFHNPHAHNECRETQAEWVQDKEKANYCDYFEPDSLARGEAPSRSADKNAKSAFDKLFRD